METKIKCKHCKSQNHIKKGFRKTQNRGVKKMVELTASSTANYIARTPNQQIRRVGIFLGVIAIGLVAVSYMN